MKVINRIKQYIDYKQISLNSFDEKIGAGNGYIGKQIKKSASIGSDIIQKIIKVFDDINPVWLLTGEGEMLKSSQDLSNKNKKSATPNSTICLDPNCLIITEEELEKRVRDLEQILSKLRTQLSFLSQTWHHLLNLDYDWIPLSNYESPGLTFEFVKDEKTGTTLIRDGLIVKVYDTLDFEAKVHYYRNLETLQNSWTLDLGNYIKQIFLAVDYGKDDFNKLINEGENVLVLEEREKEIKERLLYFATGKGMQNFGKTIRRKKSSK